MTSSTMDGQKIRRTHGENFEAARLLEALTAHSTHLGDTTVRAVGRDDEGCVRRASMVHLWTYFVKHDTVVCSRRSDRHVMQTVLSRCFKTRSTYLYSFVHDGLLQQRAQQLRST